MSELSIKVVIAGRTYPLTIEREEEELIRLAAKEVDENVKKLQDAYAVKDKQDLLAMTALQMSSQAMQKTGKADLEMATVKLESLNSVLNEYLSQ